MARDLYRGLASAGATALFAGALVAGPTPAYAQPGPSGHSWVEPHPNPVAPGQQVIVIGSCGDVNVDAVFESLAFAGGRKVEAHVDPNSGQASAEVPIPQGLRPNTYNITLFCGGTEQATSALTVADHHKQPTKGPRTGAGGAAGDGGTGMRTPLLVAGGLAAAVGGLALLFGRRRRAS